MYCEDIYIILACVTYAIICTGVFVYFMIDRPGISINLTKTEYIMVTLLLSLVSPAGLIIFVLGYPFYWLNRLFHRDEVKADNSDSDNDEPQGYDYEEHEDWSDGNTEYEDD